VVNQEIARVATLEMSILTAGAMGVACAVLSVFVVLRRWAFIGEGIAHAGFGGAGTAWVLALLFPSATFLLDPAGIYAVAVLFCLLTALAIGYVSRQERVRADTAIGIFLVASLAWGFIASGIYTKAHPGQPPPEWDAYLQGQLRLLPPAFTVAAVVVCAAVLSVVIMLKKEIVFYCFDPGLAEVSGMRVGFVHYLLIVLVTVSIVLGLRMMGSVLVTALLVLPGATGLLVSRKMTIVVATAIAVGLAGTVAGLLINEKWRFIREGPAIVIVLVILFAGAYLLSWARGIRN
jgi:ABC-type Mn2+/Zn2+ transport system permease subunit